jgi:phenylpropionate dioxygenase-like ring-hydroxylating dioxygenase large terminal subunit
VEVGCLEKNGLIFVKQDANSNDSQDEPELPDLIPDGFRVIKSEPFEIDANWKLHLESSLE